MPKNRGDISAAEFCENYNGRAHMDSYLRSYISLTPEGWERTSMNPTRLEIMGYEAEYSFYETEGVLQKLELRIESIPGRVSLSFPTHELELALMSSVWGREGSGVLDFYERRMQLIDIQQMVNYGGSGPEDFRLELPSAAVTCERTRFRAGAADDHRAGLNPKRRQNGAHRAMRSVYCCPFQPISRPEAETRGPAASSGALSATRSPTFNIAATGLSAALTV